MDTIWYAILAFGVIIIFLSSMIFLPNGTNRGIAILNSMQNNGSISNENIKKGMLLTQHQSVNTHNGNTRIGSTNPNPMQNNGSISNENIKKGMLLAQQGDFLHALNYYNRALAIDPNNTGLLVNMGDALSRTANYTNAIKYYDKALLIGIPDNNIHSSTLINKGNDLFQLKNYKDAIISYNKALEIQPMNAIANNQKNLASKILGNSSNGSK